MADITMLNNYCTATKYLERFFYTRIKDMLKQKVHIIFKFNNFNA